MIRRFVLLVAVLVPCTALAVPMPAIVLDGATNVYDFNGTSYTLGFAFTPVADLQVTSLGFFDFENNGLNESHQVGIWKDSNGEFSAPILVGTVAIGTTDPLIDNFRYTSALSGTTTLTAGQAYRIGAFISNANQDVVLWNAWNTGTTATVGYNTVNTSLISSDFPNSTVASAANASFVWPNGPQFGGFGPGFFGPNFRAEVLPEPSSLALAALGMLGISAVRRWLAS